jgi:hypothetical protein
MGESVNRHRMKIGRVEMVPYTLLDMKRSVALFDRNRSFIIVNDPSDFPAQTVPEASHSVDELLKQNNEVDLDELAEQIREKLIENPRHVCGQIMKLLKPQIDETVLAKDSEEIRKAHHRGMQNTVFINHVNLADGARDGRALLTACESLDAARRAIPDFLEHWRKAREAVSEKHGEPLTPIPAAKELECRLHLLTAVAECFADDLIVKEYLPKVYHSPQTAGKREIRAALAAADNADRKYAGNWMDHLASWDLGIAYTELVRDLPSQEELTEHEHGAMRIFDVVELIGIVKRLRQATASLSHVQERRASTLVKLGPALEAGLLSLPATIVHGDLIRMLELLTGTQVTTDSGS